MKVIVPGGMMRWAVVVLCVIVVVVAVYSMLPRAGASAHVDPVSSENRTSVGPIALWRDRSGFAWPHRGPL